MDLAEKIAEELAAEQASRAELSRALWHMSAAEREAAFDRGEIAPAQVWEWARRAPAEVPQINGEFAFIAALTPEVAEARRGATATGNPLNAGAPYEACRDQRRARRSCARSEARRC